MAIGKGKKVTVAKEEAKYFKVNPELFRSLEYHIELSPFGKGKCCCGHLDCVDVDCLIYMESKKLEKNFTKEEV